LGSRLVAAGAAWDLFDHLASRSKQFARNDKPKRFAVLRLTVSVVGSCTGMTTPTIKVITAGFYCPRNGVQQA
jgi:hypothetical protein